jgi:uncharacterized membrane protein
MNYNKLNFATKHQEHTHNFTKITLRDVDLNDKFAEKQIIQIPHTSPKYYKVNCTNISQSMSLSANNDFPIFFMPTPQNIIIDTIYINTDYQTASPFSVLGYYLEIRQYNDPNLNNDFTTLYNAEISVPLFANQYSVGKYIIPENNRFTISKDKYINMRIRGDETRNEEVILFLSGFYEIQL